MFDVFSIGTVTPWFGNTALVGAILGSCIGVLGAVFGTCLGVFAPRGIGRKYMMGFQIIVVLIGVFFLVSGITGLLLGQPYGVWYPLTLVGFISTVVFGTMLPVTRNIYRRAEGQKLEAEEFRANFNGSTG